MWRDDQIRGPPQRTALGQGFRLKDVERRAANLALFQRRRQCVLVDRRAPSDIDDPRVLRQHLQSLRGERVARAV